MTAVSDLPPRIERVLDERAKEYVGLAGGVRPGDETYTTDRGRIADHRPDRSRDRGLARRLA